jgi:CDP-diglyceride synthetase
MSNPTYKAKIVSQLKLLAGEGGISYFKHDFNHLCDMGEGNGHFPTDRHGHEANVDAMIEMLMATREANPQIYQNLTNWMWYSPWWLMYLFLLVWGADSGAYFVGRKFGKRKLAPTVSPNKSVEGLYGGILTTIIVMLVVQYQYLNLTWVQQLLFLILSLITVFGSVLGDLFESMIKRRAGIKDSGRVLPGHGGVLDRIDSLLAAAPIFATGMYILKLIGVDL